MVPHARGLGSSSAATVAGVVLARGLVAGGALLADDESLFRLAARIEGHPDNVAPAFFGGFTISGRDEDGEFYSVGSPVDPRVEVVVFVPPTPVSTAVARGLLPTAVPHGDAAADAGRTALLVAALAGRPEQLLRATRDYLHQEYRRPAMPESLDLVDRAPRRRRTRARLRRGPTVLAFTDAAGADACWAGARTAGRPPARSRDRGRAARPDGCILSARRVLRRGTVGRASRHGAPSSS